MTDVTLQLFRPLVQTVEGKAVSDKQIDKTFAKWVEPAKPETVAKR